MINNCLGCKKVTLFRSICKECREISKRQHIDILLNITRDSEGNSISEDINYKIGKYS